MGEAWLVYGAYLGEPLAMLFDSEADARAFASSLEDVRSSTTLGIARVGGIDYDAFTFTAEDE
jgi:hypothetical protein